MGIEQRPAQPLLRQFGGLNVKDSELGLPGNDSPFMRNVDLHPNGSIRMRNGTSALTTPDGETKIDALFLLNQPESSRGWIYCIADNTIYRTAEPGTWAWVAPTHASSYTLTAQNLYAAANSRYYTGSTEHASVLYLPRANGVPLIALGQTSATADLITMPAGSYGGGTPGSGATGYPSDWTTNHYPTRMRMIGVGPGGIQTVGAGAGSRMHAWGMANDKNKVYYSELGVPWNFLRSDVDDPSADPQPDIDGGHYYVERGDGDEVVSVIDMYSYTVIFKKHRTFIYTGDPGSTDWTLRNVYPVGCVSDRAWVKVGNDILFWSVTGPRSMAAVQDYGDLKYADIGAKILPSAASIQPAYTERVRCYHDKTNQRVVWFVPVTSVTTNDTAYVYYYNTGTWCVWDGIGTQVMDVLTILTNSGNNERYIAGTLDNGVCLLQTGFSDADLSEDGDIVDIAADYYTNWIQVGEISDASRILWLDVLAGDEGAECDIYYQTDLNPTWNQITRVTKSLGGSGTAWDLFNWDEALWDAASRAMLRYEVDGLFNFIRFRFAQTGQYGFEIMGFRAELRQKGPQA